jgi:proteic killer suppression protein
MIVSFACKETEKIWHGFVSKKLPAAIQERALRKLRQLDAANTLQDLRQPPSNYLEALKGDKLGQYSMRINNQWRLCFYWEHNAASNVEIIDYH